MQPLVPNDESHTGLNEDKPTSLHLIISSKMLAEGIDNHLDGRGDFDVDITHCLADGLSHLESRKDPPDLVLLDPNSQYAKGLGPLTQVIRKTPGTKVVLLSDNLEKLYIRNALRHGAWGVISKGLSMRALENALGLIAGGEIFIPANRNLPVEENRPNDDHQGDLTDIEKQCLRFSAEGFTNKEIGSELEMTEGRVKVLLRLICRKLDTRNRTHAVAKAIYLDLI